MKQVVVIGGGWSGCAAALAAKKAGAEVTLLERTDMLLGVGLVGGIMRNNGRFTGAEECIAMGGEELFKITDALARHKNVDFPGHAHASLYDVTRIEPAVRRKLKEYGIKIHFFARVTGVKKEENCLYAVTLASGEEVPGDVFVETTGTTGPMGNCLKYGNGCSMCILRCPAFGPRVSVSAQAGVQDIYGEKENETFGAMSGSCKLNKNSLSPEVRKELEEKGVVVLPVPKEFIHEEKLDIKVCQQYALPEYAENIILLDTGHAKLMTPFFPLEELRQIKGLEDARYEDPYAGGKGNSIRYLGITPRDNSLKVKGLSNLFCGGEKAGLFVGVTEAIITGTLAGHNAARYAAGIPLLVLPRTTASGDIISYVNKEMQKKEGLRRRYTMAGSHYFERMKLLGLYSTDPEEIAEWVNDAGLTDVYNQRIL